MPPEIENQRAVPTALQPTVQCTVASGAPIQVVWSYVSGDAGGAYTITSPDGTQWGTGVCSSLKPGTGYVNSTAAAGIYPLSVITDPLGNGLGFSYGATPSTTGMLLLASIHDLGTSVTLLTINRATDATGSILSVTDPYGRSVYYHINVISSKTYGFYDGYSRAYHEVDQASQLVATGVSSPSVRNTYSYAIFQNHVMLYQSSVPSPTGTGMSTATLNYDYTAGFVTSITDGNGNTVTYTEVNSNHTKVTLKNAAGVVAYSYTVGFDSYLNETTRTDGTNSTIVSTMTYADPNTPYRPSAVTDGNNRTTLFSWDVFGQLQSVTTPRGTQTTIARDYSVFPFGRVTSVQEGTKTASTFTYFEPSGLVDTVTAPAPGGSGAVTASLTYDALGNVLTATTPGNNATSTFTTTLNYTTDGLYSQAAARGQPLTVTNNLGKTSHFRYDVRGNLLSTVDPLGTESNYTYSIADQMLSATAPATGQTGIGRAETETTYQYPYGLVNSVKQYDESATLVRQSTPTYGKEGEARSATGNVTPVTLTYDGAYRVIQVKDGNNQTTQYSFNTAGYASGITYPGGDTVLFPSYDAAGNLLRRTDGNGVHTDYVYADADGLLSDVEYPSAPALDVAFTYDMYGRPTAISDGSGTRTVAYDERNAVTSVATTYTGLATRTISYGYHPNGSRASMTTPAGSFTYSFDGAGRLTGLTNPLSESFGWTYLDNNWTATQTSGGVAAASYTYNAMGFLTRLHNQTWGGATLSDWSSLGYDGAGNRTSVTTSIPAASALGGVTSYTYSSTDRMTQELSTRNSGFTFGYGYDAAGNPTTFRGASRSFNVNNQDTAHTFDGNGNPTTYSGVTLAYDLENRLASVGSTLTAGYTASGLRAWKQSAAGRTYFLYDGSTPVLELDAAGAVTAVNTHGAAGLLARNDGSASVFYTFDPQGSVVQRISGAGAVLSTHLFDAYGAEATTPSADPFGYKAQWGYYTDRETGLHLLTHRYYDAGAGRFLTRDPIGQAGGVNVYGYCGGNPVNFADPSGLTPGGGSGPGGGPSYGGSPDPGPPFTLGAGLAAGMTLGTLGVNPDVDANSPYFAVGYFGGVALTAAVAVPTALVGYGAAVAALGGGTAAGVGAAGGGAAAGTAAAGAGAAGAGAAATVAAAGSSGNGPVARVVTIVEHVDDVMIIRGEGPKGWIQVIANVSREGNSLILKNAHIEGPGPGSMGRAELAAFAREFGRQQGVAQIVVRGGERTTGLMNGRVPRPITFKVD